MVTVALSQLELQEGWGKTNPAIRSRTAFPLRGAAGTENSLVVYIELEPGHTLGRHVDSAEEVLLVLGGTVEVTVGAEQGCLSAGGLAVVPTLIPHDIRNVGAETARVVGFFGAPEIEATFDDAYMPEDLHIFKTAEFPA